jgi:hypothetical protein
MKKYLASLKDKPEPHKKRFALLVSGSATLVIFAIWTMVTFGGGTMDESKKANAQVTKEVSPFASLREGLAASFAGLSEALGGAKATFKEAVDFEADYKEMKGGVLNTYGQ